MIYVLLLSLAFLISTVFAQAESSISTSIPTSIATLIETSISTSNPTSVATLIETSISTSIPTSIPTLISTSTSTSTSISDSTSTSYPVPSYLTPFIPTTPKYNQGNFKNSYKVKQVLDYGRLTDWNNPWEVYRDGGGSCSFGNRTFWLFCDTLAYTKAGKFAGGASNSLAVARDFSHAGWLKDATIGNGVGYFPAIPFTSEEIGYMHSVTQRYALWTYTNCIPMSETTAAHFFLVFKFDTAYSSVEYGNTLALYSLDEDTNEITVSRPSQYWFPNSTYAYGSFANVVVNGVAYMYALDVQYSGKYDVHLASVPVGRVGQKEHYRYYDAGNKTWSYEQPVPTERRQSAAAIQGTEPFSSGTVYYSEYHNAYLLIFFNNWVDSTFRIISAPTPVGPWNITNSVLFRSEPGPNGYNYGGLATPVYYEESGKVAGQSVMLSYSYQDVNGTYPRALKLTFA
ncbi:hypothetical protein V1514DRAFT_330436 [Lipomyces japonicus]|uniref:uncharacterized protein n=1 Tax=Lipomyces japonicus TaxID=56871 RepID=UPI0034CF1122